MKRLKLLPAEPYICIINKFSIKIISNNMKIHEQSTMQFSQPKLQMTEQSESSNVLAKGKTKSKLVPEPSLSIVYGLVATIMVVQIGTVALLAISFIKTNQAMAQMKSQLETQIADLKTTLSSRINTLSNDINTNLTAVSTHLSNKVDTLQTAVGTNLTAIKTELDSVNTQVGSINPVTIQSTQYNNIITGLSDPVTIASIQVTSIESNIISGVKQGPVNVNHTELGMVETCIMSGIKCTY